MSTAQITPSTLPESGIRSAVAATVAFALGVIATIALAERGDLLGSDSPRTVTRTSTEFIALRTGQGLSSEVRADTPAQVPPLELIAPPRSTASVSFVEAGGGVPPQVVVDWSRGGGRKTQYGVTVWQWAAGDSVWRRIFERRFPSHLPTDVAVVRDLTGDGHKDLWVATDQGSGGCGPRRALASVDGTMRWIYRSGDVCLTRWTYRPAGLRVEDGVGPCPFSHNHYTCSGGRRLRLYRWDGSELRLVSTQVRCKRPALDPQRNCALRVSPES